MDLNAISQSLIKSLNQNANTQTQSIDQSGRVFNAEINNQANAQGILFSTRPGLDQLRNFAQQTLPAQAEVAQQAAAGEIQVRQSVADAIRQINEVNQAASDLNRLPYDNRYLDSLGSDNLALLNQAAVNSEPTGGAIAFDPATSATAPIYDGFAVGENITSVYGDNSQWRIDAGYGVHKGTDYGLSAGTPLYAPRDAVATSGFEPLGGNWTQLTYADGSSHKFFHLQASTVPDGPVSAGQQVALSGASGNNGQGFAPHLHLEGYAPDGALINPESLF